MLLACRTTDLIGGLSSNAARPTATRAAKIPAATDSPEPKGTRDPNAAFQFLPIGTPRCGAGDDNASVVKGRILEGNAPVAGQKIQASSGPGAEPISDEPAVSDDNGNYQVTFVCDGTACNGAFWVWLVDEDLVQVSPFVEFIFDNQCRRGTLDFRSR
ncbi:MAG: hypothetical protein HY741_28065 [Chloroflexi bacterium]|nr:hypothetical protein [Chloroflexota bacterium]